MYQTYTDSGGAAYSRYNGAMAAYICGYLGYKSPQSFLTCTAAVAICPAQKIKLPNYLPTPPLKVPVSYFSQSVITNDPPTGNNLVIYPFGRPTVDTTLTGRDPTGYLNRARNFQPSSSLRQLGDDRL